jgi:hypothetical protein
MLRVWRDGGGGLEFKILPKIGGDACPTFTKFHLERLGINNVGQRSVIPAQLIEI